MPLLKGENFETKSILVPINLRLHNYHTIGDIITMGMVVLV
jgi:hypothetical protein